MADTGNSGTVIEGEVRRLVSELGLADFVYLPPLPPKGGGNREVGDALLIANDLGGVFQVKARHPDAGARDSPDRTAAWITRCCQAAFRQAAGSIRNIDHHAAIGTPLLAVPYRARGLTDQEQKQAALSLVSPTKGWSSVVVVDHPRAIGVLPPRLPAFFITASDLVELMASIRSVTGFLRYVERVLDHGGSPFPLGYEQDRFSEFVAADDAVSSAPRHSPYLSWDARSDPVPVELYRDLLEHVWPQDGRLPDVSLGDYRSIVEHLDAVPSGVQADIGRLIFRKRDALEREGNWQSGLAIIEHRRAVVYACDTSANYQRPGTFVGRLLQLANGRATEFRDAYGYPVPTLGIGVLQGEHSFRRPSMIPQNERQRGAAGRNAGSGPVASVRRQC